MEDIEKFLLEQLNKAIKDVKSSSVFDECRSLKDLIEAKKENTGAAVDATRRENLYYLNNIAAEWRAVLKNHNHFSPTAQTTLNGHLFERLKKIRKELEAKAPPHKEEVDDKAAQSQEKYRGLENPYLVDRSKIWGIDDKSKAMERLLVRKGTRNNGFQAIGIVGMTGVGKTTFCQVAFNNEEVKKHFMPRIWVQISKQPEPEDHEVYKKEVVKSFLRSLGFEDNVIDKIGAESKGLDLLLLALKKQLQGKRYLVVLDDIWHLDERFKKFCSLLAEEAEDDEKYEARLFDGLPKASGGCVIVTSRSESWAIDMVGEKNLHRLTPLEDKTSIWKIYTNTINDRVDEIVKTCAGLPLDAALQKTKDEIVKTRAGLSLDAALQQAKDEIVKTCAGKANDEIVKTCAGNLPLDVALQKAKDEIVKTCAGLQLDAALQKAKEEMKTCVGLQLDAVLQKAKDEIVKTCEGLPLDTVLHKANYEIVKTFAGLPLDVALQNAKDEIVKTFAGLPLDVALQKAKNEIVKTCASLPLNAALQKAKDEIVKTCEGKTKDEIVKTCAGLPLDAALQKVNDAIVKTCTGLLLDAALQMAKDEIVKTCADMLDAALQKAKDKIVKTCVGKAKDEIVKTCAGNAKDEIVKTCAGLPLIAKMLGEIAFKTFVEDKGKGSETTSK